MANTCWTGGGQTSSKLGAAPVSNRIGPAFGWSIRVAMIATLRRGEVGLGFEGVLTPAAASAHPSSYSMLPRSRKCTFIVVPPSGGRAERSAPRRLVIFAGQAPLVKGSGDGVVGPRGLGAARGQLEVSGPSSP